MPRFSVSRVSGAPVSDAELLDDLRRVARVLSQSTVRQKQYRDRGKYDAMTQITRFGSWNKALIAAGLELWERSMRSEELLADVRRVAEHLSQSTVSIEQYRQHGKHDRMTLTSRFGSWNDVLKAAGLSKSKKCGITDEALFNNILRLWEHYGRQPRRSELARDPSLISNGPYWRRFGSWTSALHAFVEYANTSEAEDTVPTEATESLEVRTTVEPVFLAPIPASAGDRNEMPEPSKLVAFPSARRTPRDPSMRLRFKVMLRDNFSCRQCGRSPATVLGVILHIDHVVPWSKGGETVVDNLQTLCDVCNLGKSNLSPSSIGTNNEGRQSGLTNG